MLKTIDKYKGWQYKDPQYFIDRDKMMIKMAFYLGLRRREISYASVNNIDRQRKLYVVVAEAAKLNKRRVLPIPRLFYSQLISYVRKYKLKDFLFLSRNSADPRKSNPKRLNGHAIGMRFEIYRKLAGLDFIIDKSANGKNLHLYSLHDLRATFATKLNRNDVNLTIIQDLLGHENLFSTQRYLKGSDIKDRSKAINSVFNKLKL